MMNVMATIFFLLGLIAAFLYAIGMDPYSCGIPLCFVGAAIIFSSIRGDFSWRKSWVTWLIVLAAGYFSWRMYHSTIKDFGRSDGLLLAGAVGAYWCTMSQKMSHLRWIVFVLWGVLIANISVAVIQAYVDVNFYPIYGERATSTFPSGLYLHYNHFSNFMLGVGLLSLGVAFDGGGKRVMRIFSGVMFLLSVYGVVLSNSRGAMLGLGCGTTFAVIVWLLYLWRSKTTWAGVALLCAIVLSPLIITGAWHVGANAVANRGTGDGHRLELAGIAAELITEKPLWGGGSRSFFFDSLEKWDVKEMYLGAEVQYVHNEYLQAAVDYGLIGALLLLIIFCYLMFRGGSYLILGVRDEGHAGYAMGAMSALVGMGVQAFFSFVYHVLPDVMLMSICLALLSRQPWVLSRSRDQILSGRSWVMSATAIIVGVGVIGFSTKDGMAWYITRPRPDSNKLPLTSKISDLEAAVKVRPDFRVMADLSKAIVQSTADETLSMDARKNLVTKAIALQETLVERVPQSYQASLNLALMYDSAGRYDESAPLYRRIVTNNLAVEILYGVRYHYTRHLVAKGHVIWRKRQPEQALAIFLRAREQFDQIKNKPEGSNLPAVKEEIEKCITFLEGANIRPSEGD